MRKRALRKLAVAENTQKIYEQKPFVEKKPLFKKNTQIFFVLLALFFFILFFNTYYNWVSNVAYNPYGEGLDKYYLSGPDPYYNMRLVEVTYETGRYPYYSELDPLLNYPLGASGGRGPLLNMLAIAFSRLLVPFVNEIDAIGLAMQFLPALFGALIVFPVYFIGKELFNEKVGLISALFVSIIPLHLGSGHGSAFSLFDHDSFNLLLFFLTFLFLIKSIKERDFVKSNLYAILGGISLAALSMVWVEAQFLYNVIAIYAVVQIFVDIFMKRTELKFVTNVSVLMFSGYIISLPVTSATLQGLQFDIELLLCIVVAAFGSICYLFHKKRIPWTISVPAFVILAIAGLVFLYFIPLLAEQYAFLSPIKRLSDVIFGRGIYGDKVSMTIAEAHTFSMSYTAMSIGPALYWAGWGGFILIIWHFFREKLKREYLFILVLFVIDLWLTTTAGRFLNDTVPLMAILAGCFVWFIISKIDYKQMLKNIRSAGGGLHGLRKGMKLMHIVGILFIAILLIFPNVFLSFDAAVPGKMIIKEKEDWKMTYEEFLKYYNEYRKTGEEFNIIFLKQLALNDESYSGAFGLSVHKEMYWTDALKWLAEQDKHIEKPEDRPAFISWWDYGFYESALGRHPTVADNFQDGIPPAANFHTATSESEAVAVLIVRLLEGDAKRHNKKLSDEVKQVLVKYVGENDTSNISSWIEEPKKSPSYRKPIGEKYDEELSRNHTIGEQWAENAFYHDIIALFKSHNLTDDQITWLYHEIQNVTGFSIRYYGVEGYDMQIFNIFAFLADKSLILFGAPEDDFVEVYYTGYEINPVTGKQTPKQWSLKEIKDMTLDERRNIHITGTTQKFKDPYFETMFYKTYIGPYKLNEDGTKDISDFQIPCKGMKHFYGEFISDLSNPLLQYYAGKGAVVIAKYYEGAYLNGTVWFNEEPLKDIVVAVYKNLTYTSDLSLPIEHDRCTTNEAGNFSLIAGAGSEIRVLRDFGNEQVFFIKNVTFNDPNSSIYAPITDEDAMRKSNNYERTLNITIDPANVMGYVFEDKDEDGEFNATVDEPLKNVNLNIYEITSISGGNASFGSISTANITNEGYYLKENLLPGYYRLILINDDNFYLAIEDLPLYAGNTTFNLTSPKPSNLEGIVFYDEDFDGNYTAGEEIANVTVELIHGEKIIKTTKTDSSGKYRFESIIPGKISDIDINEYVVKVRTFEYEATESVYPEENKTTTLNISLQLAPVEVSGKVIFNGSPVDNVTVSFEPDGSVEKNTAETNSTTTNEKGEFTLLLKPGKYNYTAIKKEGDITVYESEVEHLTLLKGEKFHVIAEPINLEKKSVTVTGKTMYSDAPVGNVSLIFMPNYEKENNTAGYAYISSDENGFYEVELSLGSYIISANKEENISGNIYVYSISNETKNLELTDAYIATGYTFNIKLERSTKESK